MAIKLSHIIQLHVDSSKQHDVQSILSCFSEDVIVRDEAERLQGKNAIKDWITNTIEKYKFQFKPLNIKQEAAEIVVAVEVSGTFDGSPFTPDYDFMIESNVWR